MDDTRMTARFVAVVDGREGKTGLVFWMTWISMYKTHRAGVMDNRTRHYRKLGDHGSTM
jgi:hypothetical protein